MTMLYRLEPEECATVTDMGDLGALEARLRDFGLVKGTRVVCKYLSPDRAVGAYKVRGAVLALRRADIAGITVRLHE